MSFKDFIAWYTLSSECGPMNYIQSVQNIPWVFTLLEIEKTYLLASFL